MVRVQPESLAAGRMPCKAAGPRMARQPGSQSMKPDSSSLRAGAYSLRTALASICRIRSRVTLKMWPTSSSV